MTEDDRTNKVHLKNLLGAGIPKRNVRQVNVLGARRFLDGSISTLISRNHELFLKANDVIRATLENRRAKTHG